MTWRQLAFCAAAIGCILPAARGGDGAEKALLTVGEEFVLAADGPGGNSRGAPAVAYGAGGYLCVWREGWEGRNGGARIRAARVAPTGRGPAQPSVEVAPNKMRDAPQEHPRVAFCKDTFLVVWQDLRSGTDYDVLAARLSADGALLDSTPIRIADGKHNQALPDVAADDRGFLVVWQAYNPADHAYHGFAARVGVDGAVGTPNDIGMCPCLRVAWDGAKFLVASAGSGPLQTGHARCLASDGTPSKEKPIAITGRVGDFSLSAVPGKGWVFITHRSKPDPWGWGGPGAIRSYAIGPDGKPDAAMPKEEGAPKYALQPNWLDAATQDRAAWPYGPTASAWDGKQTVVVWTRFHGTGEKRSALSNGDLVATRTDGWRRQADVAVTVSDGEHEELNPALASDAAGRLFCVYEKEVGAKTVLCGRHLTSR